LPVELPSSMAAVERQDPARPDDSEKPLFPYGAGL
jgi:beta-glucosidase